MSPVSSKQMRKVNGLGGGCDLAFSYQLSAVSLKQKKNEKEAKRSKISKTDLTMIKPGCIFSPAFLFQKSLDFNFLLCN